MADLAQALMGDNSDTLIGVRLYYTFEKTDQGANLVKVLDDSKAEQMLEDDSLKDEVKVLNTKWKQVSWREQNQIIKSCQSPNPTTGIIEVDWGAYRDQRIKTLMVDWDLMYEGEKVPLSHDVIDKLPADIVLRLFEKYEDATGLSREDEGK